MATAIEVLSDRRPVPSGLPRGHCDRFRVVYRSSMAIGTFRSLHHSINYPPNDFCVLAASFFQLLLPEPMVRQSTQTQLVLDSNRASYRHNSSTGIFHATYFYGGTTWSDHGFICRSIAGPIRLSDRLGKPQETHRSQIHHQIPNRIDNVGSGTSGFDKGIGRYTNFYRARNFRLFFHWVDIHHWLGFNTWFDYFLQSMRCLILHLQTEG